MPKVETFDKELVISQVTNVFHDKGFNATSMQDIVDATGLNRSSIYNSFGSKHALFLQCLQAYQNKYNSLFSVELLKAANPLEAINFIFDLYLKEILKSNKDKGCMIVNCTSEMAYHDNAITTFLENNKNKMVGMLEDLVNKGQEDGYINTEKTFEDYALYLFSAIQGFRMTGILVSDRDKLKNIIHTTLQTLT
ncbi:TetR/AcrR family transcriptional regulator [Seonamhaeicola marinus]|uniref:TetR/AcrR family transcriptional regulator n=1 Tax=Seonamhaeicola marinus TaxID=1912246 RepID=A0A5D0HKV2_9FLAO|nr:TetR/AcrR family transcriptional regulator [Seonamhaeicola marinus]TYA71918.1 TetR/AcrR family transcriptional regulator [Seonamhaeicola marinus]